MRIYRFDTGESLITGLNPSLLCALAVLILITPPCASARNRAAEKLRGEARAAEVEGKFDDALRLAKQARPIPRMVSKFIASVSRMGRCISKRVTNCVLPGNLRRRWRNS